MSRIDTRVFNAWLITFAVLLLFSMPRIGNTQLAECAQIDEVSAINVAGGCINKTLMEQIGAGQGDEFTPGSSVYLIKRDPARSIRRGRQLFQRKFTADEGVGPRVNFSSRGDMTTMRALGAGLADSCAACHGRPRGSAGFGGDVVTFPDSRDAPHLFGLGLIEMLADEMTSELREIRDQAAAEAANPRSASQSRFSEASFFKRAKHFFNFSNGAERHRHRGSARRRPSKSNGDGSVTRQLTSNGIDFGYITALPDGTVDTSAVEGVDENLRVKPFFHEGRTVSIREFIVGALNDEMGLQAWDPILCAATDPVSPQRSVSPAGFVFDPATDDFNRPPVCDAVADPDIDSVTGEIDPALVDHMEFYLLNYFKPGRYEITARAASGLELMESIGCTSCHVQDLTIKKDRRVADVETGFDPQRGIFNDLFAEAETLFKVVEDGDAYPQLIPMEQSFVVQNVFTDLKRHDLGPAFAERDFDGTRITEHVTEPLWGVGTSAPYGHDGRSVNLDAVIRRHGGEAGSVTQAYQRLDDNSRAMIHEFLQTLVLFPPDDTASSLNAGDPAGSDPQDPDIHGSINLAELFQIPGEGGE